MTSPVKVGEILLEAGLIDEMQLRAALGEQARWGRPLGATLVKLGFVEEHDLVRALASQLDLPIARLEGKRIRPDVLGLVPREMAEQRHIVPLFVKREHGIESLFIGVEDPGDLETLDDLAFRTGLEVRPVMVGPSELEAAIDRYYRGVETPAPTPAEVPEPESGICELAGADAPAESTSALATEPGTQELARHLTQTEVPRARPEEGETSETGGETTSEVELVSAEEPIGIESQQADAGSESDQPPESTSEGEVDTRTILRALTQLLIEKGVLTRDELHARVHALRALESGGAG